MNRAERRKITKEINIFTSAINILKQYFPALTQKFEQLTDTRNQSYTQYSMSVITTVRLLALICGIKSSREATATLNTDEAIANICQILDIELEELPHGDTIIDVFKEIKIDELRELQKYMLTVLIRSKMFDKYRYKGKYFQVVIDGTGLYSFKEKHCDHCLTKKHKKDDGTEYKTYHHYVLEAKLVVGDIVISLDTEFVENEKEDVEKQDCELKAFYRMAERIKKNYPKLPIIITGDSLYACEPVMELCRSNGWEYILRFKTGSIPTLVEEFETLIGYSNESNKSEYEFVNEISYKEQKINIYRYTETQEDETTIFTWITSIRITNNNVKVLTEKGRKRWKIENEGFNIQKTKTFDIEHVYSMNYNAMKANYFFIQFAHTIRQLLEKGIQLISEIKMSIKEVSAALREALTQKKMQKPELKKIQLRFSSD